jgi:hypothetical protein
MEKTYKLIELVGISKTGYEDAIKNAIEEAKRTLKGLSWFEVVELRGGIKDGEIEYQAKLKVAFKVMRES